MVHTYGKTNGHATLYCQMTFFLQINKTAYYDAGSKVDSPWTFDETSKPWLSAIIGLVNK